MGSGNNLESLSLAVENAKRALQAASLTDEAKRGSNYANAIANNRTADGRSLNIYDYNVYDAERRLAEAEKRLAEEKKRVGK